MLKSLIIVLLMLASFAISITNAKEPVHASGNETWEDWAEETSQSSSPLCGTTLPEEAESEFRRFASAELGLAYARAFSDNPDWYHSELNLRSVELMAQHLWNGEGGIVDGFPTWRLGYREFDYFLDIGWRPVIKPSQRDEVPSNRWKKWFAGFQTANYLAYGVRFNQGVDSLDITTFFPIADSIIYGFSGALPNIGPAAEHRTVSEAEAMHYHLGPQVSLGRVFSRGRLSFDTQALLQLGVQRIRLKYRVYSPASNGQSVIRFVGSNDPAAAKYEETVFAQLAELRLRGSYQIKPNFCITGTLSTFVTGPFYQAQGLFTDSILGYSSESHKRLSTDYLTGANLYLGVTYLR